MGLISSKTLIQAHAVFLVVIAGYLVKSPEVITDCDLVFMMGEALNIVSCHQHFRFTRQFLPCWQWILLDTVSLDC